MVLTYLRYFSRVPRRLFIRLNSPYAIGLVSILSRHATAYRWRSLSRVRRHRASKPQGSSKRVLPWQVTMDQLICTSLCVVQRVRSICSITAECLHYCIPIAVLATKGYPGESRVHRHVHSAFVPKILKSICCTQGFIIATTA